MDIGSNFIRLQREVTNNFHLVAEVNECMDVYLRLSASSEESSEYSAA